MPQRGGLRCASCALQTLAPSTPHFRVGGTLRAVTVVCALDRALVQLGFCPSLANGADARSLEQLHLTFGSQPPFGASAQPYRLLKGYRSL